MDFATSLANSAPPVEAFFKNTHSKINPIIPAIIVITITKTWPLIPFFVFTTTTF